MKQSLIPNLALFSLTLSLGAAPVAVDSVTFATPTVGDVTIASITTAEGTFTSFGSYSVIGTVGGNNDEVFYQDGTTDEPLNQTEGIADGLRADTGGLNVPNLTIQLDGSFTSNTRLFIFDIASLDTFSLNLINSSGDVVGDTLNIGTSDFGGDVDTGDLLNLDRKDNDQDPAAALGNLSLQGFSISLSDFSGDLTGASGIRFSDGGDGIDIAAFGVSTIPEPSAFASLLGLLVMGLASLRRRNK